MSNVAAISVMLPVVDLDNSFIYECEASPVTFSDMLSKGVRYLEDNPKEFSDLMFVLGIDARYPSKSIVKTVYDRSNSLTVPDALQVIFDEYCYGAEFES